MRGPFLLLLMAVLSAPAVSFAEPEPPAAPPEPAPASDAAALPEMPIVPEPAPFVPPVAPVHPTEPEPPPLPLERRWADGPDRWFVSGLIDIGPLYFRPRASAGWGSPFHRWVGVDANPLISGEGIGAYAGIRAVIPFLDFRAGARYFSTFSRSFLVPRQHYSRLALEVRSGPKSAYATLEAELTSSVPLGPGSIPIVLTGAYVTLVPEGYWVFEDTLKVVAAPPWIWVARTGYELGFGPNSLAKVALVGEVVGSPERPALIARLGLVGSYRMWDVLEIRAAVVPAIVSPDTIGGMHGQWFEIGLRFRFATEVNPHLSLPTF